VSRQPIDLVAFAETYDIPAELDVYHWAQLLVSGIREATDRKEITSLRDGRTELPVVALQLIAEFMPSSRSADVGFRFDRGVMTEVLVVVHEPTRNMLIESRSCTERRPPGGIPSTLQRIESTGY
jgi:hypothetical protein